MGLKSTVRIGDENRTLTFFLKLFGHRRDIPAKSRDIPAKKFDFPGFEGHTELFGPHPSTWKTPTPPENIQTQKFRFGFLFVPDLSGCRKMGVEFNTSLNCIVENFAQNSVLISSQKPFWQFFLEKALRNLATHPDLFSCFVGIPCLVLLQGRPCFLIVSPSFPRILVKILVFMVAFPCIFTKKMKGRSGYRFGDALNRKKTLQVLQSWAWLPKFCRTFAILYERVLPRAFYYAKPPAESQRFHTLLRTGFSSSRQSKKLLWSPDVSIGGLIT